MLLVLWGFLIYPIRVVSRARYLGKVCRSWWSADYTDCIVQWCTLEQNKSVFGYLRTLTKWHCPHSLAARPVIRAHSSKPAAAGLLLWVHAGIDIRTDWRTDTVPFHRPHYACSANKTDGVFKAAGGTRVVGTSSTCESRLSLPSLKTRIQDDDDNQYRHHYCLFTLPFIVFWLSAATFRAISSPATSCHIFISRLQSLRDHYRS